MTGPPAASTPGVTSGEVARKLIHMSTSVAALAVWFLPRGPALALLGAAVLSALGVELARRTIPSVRYRFLRSTRRMLRPRERAGLSGATHLAIAYFLSALVLPRPVAVAAILYGALGDPAAGLVGRLSGRGRMPWGKRWPGFVAGFAVDAVVGLAIPGIGPVAAATGAVVAAGLEFLPLPLDDNLRTTIGGGAALFIATGIGSKLA